MALIAASSDTLYPIRGSRKRSGHPGPCRRNMVITAPRLGYPARHTRAGRSPSMSTVTVTSVTLTPQAFHELPASAE